MSKVLGFWIIIPLFLNLVAPRSISSRPCAQLASAHLQDLNVGTQDKQAAVIDKSKVFHERIKVLV